MDVLQKNILLTQKKFEGYSLDKEVISILGIVLTEADQIAKSEEVTLDYPKAVCIMLWPEGEVRCYR